MSQRRRAPTPPEPSGTRAAIDRAIWAQIDAALVRLHEGGRHAIRILDAGCGPGNWLLRVAMRARDMGFTAVDGIGFDRSAEMIAFARAQASLAEDAHVGLHFDLGGLTTVLAGEDDASFDILLCLGDALSLLTLGQRNQAMAELARVADGDLFVQVRTSIPLSLVGHPTPQPFTPAGLAHLLPPSLRTVAMMPLGPHRLLLHARAD
jgi:SAM-dependent methyltransferase